MIYNLHACKNCASRVLSRNCSIDAAQVLSQENRTRCVATLLKFRPVRLRGKPEKQAAVLVPLCFVQEQLSLLYTVRSTNLRTNRGEVSFPGGMQDPGETLYDTALRELHEELGIPAANVDVWGQGNTVGTYSGTVSVQPIVAFLGHVDLAALRKNPAEVEAVFSLTLEELCSPRVCRHTHFKSRALVMPLFCAGPRRVWGLTAVITHFFLKALVPQHYTKVLRILPPVGPRRHTPDS